MKITPMDILHKQFTQAFRGYNPQEVNDFMSQVGGEIENMLQERTQLLSEIEGLRKSLESYHNVEETLRNTLVLAQKTAEDTVAAAKKEAELAVEDAKRKGSEIQEEFARIKAVKEQFLADFIALLQSYLERARQISSGTQKEIDGY